MVREFISSKISSFDANFLICAKGKETAIHALFLCDHARACWFRSYFGFLSHNFLNQSLRDWRLKYCENDAFSSHMSNDHSKMRILVPWWVIWKTRNDFVFRKLKISPPQFLQLLIVIWGIFQIILVP